MKPDRLSAMASMQQEIVLFNQSELTAVDESGNNETVMWWTQYFIVLPSHNVVPSYTRLWWITDGFILKNDLYDLSRYSVAAFFCVLKHLAQKYKPSLIKHSVRSNQITRHKTDHINRITTHSKKCFYWLTQLVWQTVPFNQTESSSFRNHTTNKEALDSINRLFSQCSLD